MAAVTLAILATTLALLITWWFVEYYKNNRHLLKYPGPRPLPLIGTIHHFSSLTKVIPVLQNFHKKFGATFKIMIFNRMNLVSIDIKMAEFLLASTTILSKSPDYRYLEPWLGKGLLTSTGVKWKKQRKLLNPAFHYQIVEQFLEVFNTQTDILVKKLLTRIGENHFDIFPDVALCALDIICGATMGAAVNAQFDFDSEFVHSERELTRIAMDRSISVMKRWDFFYSFSKDYHIEKRGLAISSAFVDSIINERREKLVNKTGRINDEHCDTKQKFAVLDLLLQCCVDGKPLSNETIREEAGTFIAAGHLSVATGISFTLYCLSKHPEAQQKALEEQQEIFLDDPRRPPAYKDLQNMKYLEMAIKEALRLYPPIPLILRYLDEDVNFNGAILPKGLTIMPFIYGIHRNAEIYPDPDKFDPERFSLENSAGRSPYAYLPFSSGPRNCIGQRFAMMELKVVVSLLLRNFELLPVVEHEPLLATAIVMKSVNGIPVVLKKRTI